jgi:alcohol dehydrogenase
MLNQKSPSFPPGRAAIFHKAGLPFQFLKKDLPALKEGEILIRNIYTTLCGSDLHTYCGRRIEPENVVLGHEIVGDVLWIDAAHPGVDANGNKITVGDRVVWSIFSVPANITPPREDMPQKSSHLFKYGHALADGNDIFNGGLADYCILRANTAFIKISHSLPVKVAATIGCAHATVMGAIRVAGDVSNKKVLIFGAGLLGLSCVCMCKEFGAAGIGLIDKDIHRLQWGRKFGADDIYEFPGKDDAFPWQESDIVFDMTGYPDAMLAGIRSLRTGGCAVWIGAVFPSEPVSVNAEMIVRKLLQIRGLHNYNYDDFCKAAAFIENNNQTYPFGELIEKEFSLDQVDDAFEFASKKKPVRVGIAISLND